MDCRRYNCHECLNKAGTCPVPRTVIHHASAGSGPSTQQPAKFATKLATGCLLNIFSSAISTIRRIAAQKTSSSAHLQRAYAKATVKACMTGSAQPWTGLLHNCNQYIQVSLHRCLSTACPWLAGRSIKEYGNDPYHSPTWFPDRSWVFALTFASCVRPAKGMARLCEIRTFLPCEHTSQSQKSTN